MKESELVENQIRKLRRRVEEYLRQDATPNELIKFAKQCGITIPKLLSDLYDD